jgi:hypothetical protein
MEITRKDKSKLGLADYIYEYVSMQGAKMQIIRL